MARSRDNYRPWTRAEYDLVEKAVLRDNRRYADIAAELGRGIHSVRGAAQRIGVSERRSHWRALDWSTIDKQITDLIECQRLSVPQIAKHLKALGQPIHKVAVYRRLETLPRAVRDQAHRNGTHRRVVSAVTARQRERARRRVKRLNHF